MMGAVRSWLLAVIAASLLCAVAGALMPPGGVKRVGRLVCGLVLLGAVLSPAATLDAAEGQRWLEGWLDKAAELGLTCRARVECQPSEDGLYLPVRTEVAGPMTAEVQGRLIRTIAEDLGVPPEAQIYMEEEEMP